MKGLKDFLYNKNDILIALVILVAAALLIIWRMDVIMEYPKTLAEKTGTVSTTDESAVDADKDGSKAASDLWANGVLTKSVTVTVQGGSASAAVQSLVDAHLFKSYDEYVKVCKAAGAVPENIKATTFTFKAGSTQTDIAVQVTK